MKPLWKDVLTALFMGMILPGILVHFAVQYQDSRPQEAAQPVIAETQTNAPALTVNLLTEAGNVVQMDMDTYLVGVVLAEMPASFEAEALKAQSVVARTYAQKAWETGGKHGNNSVCTEASCCQGYLPEEEYLAKGGTEEGLEKIRRAVTDTSGYVLTYRGALIEATYFSCSGGSTEDAVAVWGTDFPYLQAVSSPGEEDAAHYSDTVIFSAQEFRNALNRDLPGTPRSWFGIPTYTEGGGVASLSICGQSYTGTQLRQLLNLRSTAFDLSAGENSVTIITKGYGHRVGMSQYGADAMAVTGSSFEEILSHYYQGTALQQIIP